MQKSNEEIIGAAIDTWVKITDNTPEDASTYAKAYLKLDQIVPNLVEEAKELKDAVEAVDDIETLDGVVDVFFMLLQAMQALQIAGFDVMGATKAVCENNMAKFTVSKGCAEAWCWDRNLNSRAQGQVGEYSVFSKDISENSEEPYILYGVRRNSDGKIMKPLTHPKVDLTPFLPTSED